jgi:MFS family permease
MRLGQEARRDGGSAGFFLKGSIMLVVACIAIYMVSQFFRNSINVIGPDLAREYDLDARSLSLVASIFFLSFAVVQIPLGMAIDRYGPKICLVVPALVTIAGTLMFAWARGYWELVIARAVIGVGCSSFLMAPLAIYADRFPPTRFGTLVGLHVGAGSLGAIGATAPLAWSAAAWGWRAAFLFVAVLTALLIVLILVFVREGEASRERRLAKTESLADLFRGVGAVSRIESFWPIFVMQLISYPAFGAIVALWSGPWLAQVYGVPLEPRGNMLLMLTVAQVVGLFVFGPADRWFRSYKIPCLIGATVCSAVLGLAALVPIPAGWVLAYLILLGFVFGFSPALTAHGKSLFPPHLIGRGLSIMNIAAIGGVYLQQWLTGQVMDLFDPQIVNGVRTYPPEAFRWVFGVLAIEILLGVLIYTRARDPHPDRYSN